jgi:hypothetical protein
LSHSTSLLLFVMVSCSSLHRPPKGRVSGSICLD